MVGYTFRISTALEGLLSKIAGRKRTTKEEILRRAIAYYALIDEKLSKSDQPVKIRIEKAGESDDYEKNDKKIVIDFV